MRDAHLVPIIQIPYFDDIDVDDVQAVLQGLAIEVVARPKATPVP